MDDEHAHAFADQIVRLFDGKVSLLEAKLAAEIVGVGVRAACEACSAHLDHHEDATLGETYQLVRSTLGLSSHP